MAEITTVNVHEKKVKKRNRPKAQFLHVNERGKGITISLISLTYTNIEIKIRKCYLS
ncbi:hypothetical protein SAMN05660461_1088 [Chitinophaga ginsengisegetis]|uniref:Uncharacterized protein n=1 Tax=Chitinophaga ginsengisegetis TaxID=393003 RepID=A0A1T5NCJ2_9BACT|nr:hypothetical protein SAMN05660461_1088 [Chitinophaga ginsengisegetis]